MTARGIAALGMAALLASTAFAQGEGPDHARKRWEYFYEQRAFPYGSIPAGAMQAARQQVSSMRATQSLLRSSFSSAPPPIAGTTWDALGPTLIGARDIGRTSAIAVDPTNANILYIGGAQGGVWKSTDKGGTWTPLTDKQCSLAMGSIAIDPVNPQIVYAATGEQHFSGDSYYGCGVLRTIDGGATWTQLGATQFTAGAHNSRISRIVVVSTGAGTLASTTLFASADNGLWKSSNGGTTWSLMRQGYYTDVAVADAAGQTVYAAQYQVGVFRSDNGGTTWSTLGAGFATDSVGRINIALAKSQANTIVAAVANVTSSALRGIYKSTDAGATWSKLSATNANCAPQCWYDMLIAVHPTDATVIYFGGVSLYKSVDGGSTFTFAGSGLHSDNHFLTFDPTNSTRIYLTGDGGVFKSDNAGASWESLNAGLGLTQFYPGVALHPADPSIVLAGTQDNGTLLTTGSPNWSAAFGGDGGFSAIDYENPLIRYVETQWPGGPRRADDGFSYFGKGVGINTSDNAAFIPPLVMDPTDPKVLYFGTQRLYRTADRAESWTPISNNFSGVITAIAPAPSNPSQVYVGTVTGQVQVTTDLTNWTVRTSGLPVLSVTDIAVDRTDANTAVVVLSGFSASGHVFRTTNGGTSWTNVSGNLPNLPVNAIALDPVARGTLMVGTDLGVFISSDSGGTWTVVDDGMPNVAVFDIAYNPNTGTLIAATHGRGMFRLRLNRPLAMIATPTARRTDVVLGSTTVVPDSASVILSGLNAGSSGWTATHTAAATWLSLTTSFGTGSGKVRWNKNPTGLSAGLLVDTITVTTAGALDSPAIIVDTLNVCSATPLMSVDVPKRGSTLNAGVVLGAPDSSFVQFACGSGNGIAWTAAARNKAYIVMSTSSGTGSNRVRWNRRADTLKAGTYRDTIDVTSPDATGTPFIADSLVVKLSPQLGLTISSDTVYSGAATPKGKSTALTIFGDPGSSAWTLTHLASATWTSITTAAGNGNATLQWSKSSANLVPGLYYDTVTVTVAGAPAIKLQDKFVVMAPELARTCALSHYFNGTCLDATQLKYLDITGNNDGTYNLGDVLAYLARTPKP